ncbi:Beta-hexosaminidase, eukaryotic type, N-terminal, partial [Dillenia turbinata]
EEKDSSSYLIHLVSAFITLISLGCLTPPISAQINVWPKPRILSWPTPHAIRLYPAFAINDVNNCPNLSTAVNCYQTLVRSENYRPLLTPALNISDTAPLLQTLTVFVADPGAPLKSYTLRIPAANGGTVANLTAKTVWGGMRGLETFSQLGSYGPGMMYSTPDIHRIVQFGLDHGVRVLPEVDSHGQSTFLSSSEFVCFFFLFTTKYIHTRPSAQSHGLIFPFQS